MIRLPFVLAVMALTLLTVVETSATADVASCNALLTSVNAPTLELILSKVEVLDPKIIAGAKTPVYQDFQNLNEIIVAIRASKKAATDAGKLIELEEAFNEIAQSVPDRPALVALRDAWKNGSHSDAAYLPTEYELKSEYQSLLWQLNRELPRDLKIRGVRPPYDTRLPGLVTQAKAQLIQQEKRFEPFFADSGFENLGKLKKALVAFDETAGKISHDLESENVELAMNRPENARWWTPRVGFQNQRITGNSRGSYAPDFRDMVEAKMTGRDLAQYKLTDNQFKPNYGYLRAKPQAEFHQSTAASQYGDDVYIFDKKKVSHRLTWTSGDSFGPAQYASEDVALKPKNWKGFFIPWKYRQLMVPDILESAEGLKSKFAAATPNLLGRNATHAPIAPTAPAYEGTLRAAPTAPIVPYPDTLVAPPYPPMAWPDYPVGITYPTYPTMPIPPMMPELKEGEKFEDALAAFNQSDGYKAWQAEQKRLTDDYEAKSAVWRSTGPMKKYTDDCAAASTESARINAEYAQSDAVKLYEKTRADILAEFQNGETWKAYQADLARYQVEASDYQKAVSEQFKKFTESEIYVQYKKDLETYEASKPAQYKKWVAQNQQYYPYISYRGTSLESFKGPQSHGYIELQYWGPLTLDDVKIFEFKKTPPTGEFLKELQKHGIFIRDGRVDPAVPWVPSP